MYYGGVEIKSLNHWVIESFMNQIELKNRTKNFAIRIINLYRGLPKAEESRIIGKQILRSGTSVAANYRAVCRARSHADFIAKMSIVVEEMDETLFWMEILIDAKIISSAKLTNLQKEADELMAILAASLQTAKQNSKKFK